MKKIKFIENLILDEKIKLVEPSEIVMNSYILKSNNSLFAAKILYKQNLLEESISMSYYSMYHICLALFFKIGIKCENHSATIILLKELFNLDNSKISNAKEERIDKQYYTDFKITKEETEELIKVAEIFKNEIFTFFDKLSKEKNSKYLSEFKNTYFKE